MHIKTEIFQKLWAIAPGSNGRLTSNLLTGAPYYLPDLFIWDLTAHGARILGHLYNLQMNKITDKVICRRRSTPKRYMQNSLWAAAAVTSISGQSIPRLFTGWYDVLRIDGWNPRKRVKASDIVDDDET